ncbi:MAG: hypothetical protein ABRQ38_07555 [Candidatus Eremiobacterota bacterium]|jgi:hypothetical protein
MGDDSLKIKDIFDQMNANQRDFMAVIEKLSEAIDSLSDKFGTLKKEVKNCKSCMVKNYSRYFGALLLTVIILAIGKEVAWPVLSKLFKL